MTPNPIQPAIPDKESELDLCAMLKAYRKNLGMNQTQFAKRYGLETPTAVSFWESGFRDIPSRVVADVIQAFFVPRTSARSVEEIEEAITNVEHRHDTNGRTGKVRSKMACELRQALNLPTRDGEKWVTERWVRQDVPEVKKITEDAQ